MKSRDLLLLALALSLASSACGEDTQNLGSTQGTGGGAGASSSSDGGAGGAGGSQASSSSTSASGGAGIGGAGGGSGGVGGDVHSCEGLPCSPVESCCPGYECVGDGGQYVCAEEK